MYNVTLRSGRLMYGKSNEYYTTFVCFTVTPCILIHEVLFTPTHALFHTTMYQSFKLH